MQSHERYFSATILFLTLALFPPYSGSAEGEQNMKMTLTSTDFSHKGDMPASLTCDGEDLSPALNWSNLPADTKTLVLIVDDPDAPDPQAPKLTWVHWLLYNIPASSTGLAHGINEDNLPTGTLLGRNDWKKPKYGGPCPPIGRHRYFHKLYALDVVLPDLNEPNKKELEQAMDGHIIGKAELIGTYRR